MVTYSTNILKSLLYSFPLLSVGFGIVFSTQHEPYFAIGFSLMVCAIAPIGIKWCIGTISFDKFFPFMFLLFLISMPLGGLIAFIIYFIRSF